MIPGLRKKRSIRATLFKLDCTSSKIVARMERFLRNPGIIKEKEVNDSHNYHEYDAYFFKQ